MTSIKPLHIVLYSLHFRNVKEGEETEQSQDVPVLSSDIDNRTQTVEDLDQPVQTLAETEEQEVMQYIEKFQKNCGIIPLINSFLIALAKKSDKLW